MAVVLRRAAATQNETVKQKRILHRQKKKKKKDKPEFRLQTPVHTTGNSKIHQSTKISETKKHQFAVLHRVQSSSTAPSTRRPCCFNQTSGATNTKRNETKRNNNNGWLSNYRSIVLRRRARRESQRCWPLPSQRHWERVRRLTDCQTLSRRRTTRE
jgi:hypothetical protein